MDQGLRQQAMPYINTMVHRWRDFLQTGDKYYYKKSSVSQGKGSMLLSNKYKHLFTNKQIVCIEYQDLPDTDEQERDFRHFLCSCKFDSRVQLGLALTPAEKLQYLESNSPLAGDEFNWDCLCGSDFWCIPQALYLISKYPHQASLEWVLQLKKWLCRQVKEARSKGLPVPVLLMGESSVQHHEVIMYNPILAYERDKAVQDAHTASANGYIIKCMNAG
ncbi:hypothetical protein EV401DRAFT_2113322 [Pisolithus croceorrhizus]|nr:hypothetical protein EV401DRAFT_2113322 [Pisolithus croceorrhizus]